MWCSCHYDKKIQTLCLNYTNYIRNRNQSMSLSHSRIINRFLWFKTRKSLWPNPTYNTMNKICNKLNYNKRFIWLKTKPSTMILRFWRSQKLQFKKAGEGSKKIKPKLKSSEVIQGEVEKCAVTPCR